MIKLQTKSIWGNPPQRFYNFLKYAEKYNLKKNLLVIGCSDGTYVIPAAKRGFDVVGIDIDREAIYGGASVLVGNHYLKNSGLKKRLELEKDVVGKVFYKVCDFMNYNPKDKFSLIFTSGSIHYEQNRDKNLEQMITKMINMLCDKGILLIEYIHKDHNTDKNRYFVSKEELNCILDKINNIRIISHKVKKYIEKNNPRDNKIHQILWGRVYIQKLNHFQK